MTMNMSLELLQAAVIALRYADENRAAVVREYGLDDLVNTSGEEISWDEEFEWARGIFEELLRDELGI